MIQLAIPEDLEAIIALAIAAEMFADDETEALRQVLADYFGGKSNEGHVWLVDKEVDKLRGVAYYGPALMADRTWYLYMIALQPESQGQGYGTALIQSVENALQTTDQRLLLVETSGLPQYDLARAFYIKCGYEQEARIRDFYTTGDDKIVLRKVLNHD
jgi:ribosomal protein S18 acetylase RimI-like enzyme